MEPIEALRRRWAAVKGRRDALEAEAISHVRRWIWTTHNSVWWRFQPFYAERADESPGRILAAPPEQLRNVDAYGYDGQGRLVLARLYRGAPGEDDVVVVEHEGSRSWTSFLDVRGGTIRVGLVERDADGRVSAVTEYQEESGVATWSRERYVWDGGRLTDVYKRYDDEGESEEQRARWATEERRTLEYDEHGDLTAIRHGERYDYRRPDTDIVTVLRRFEQALTVAVDLALAGAEVRPFALALLYDADRPIPPTLVAGSSGDLEAGLNPAEWDGAELPLALDALGIEVGVLAGAVGRNEAEDDARAALNRAAKRLNRSPPEAWGDDPPVVFAVDLELEHLEENLRAAVPAARRRQLSLP
jgi:hypothetical protein